MYLKVTLTSGFNQRGDPINRHTQNRFNGFCNHRLQSHLQTLFERARTCLRERLNARENGRKKTQIEISKKRCNQLIFNNIQIKIQTGGFASTQN